MQDFKKNLEDTFASIVRDLDEMDTLREKLLSIQRNIVRKSSEIIKRVHRNELGDIQVQFSEIKVMIEEFEKLNSKLPLDLPKDYELILKQEFGEAAIFYDLIINDQLKKPEEIGLNSYQYCYAIADVMGELRRFCLSCLIKEKIEESLKIYNYMEEIYSVLFSLDYPSGLIPGLRKKIDVARNSLNSTQSEITMILNIQRLREDLKKK
jgi:translin